MESFHHWLLIMIKVNVDKNSDIGKRNNNKKKSTLSLKEVSLLPSKTGDTVEELLPTSPVCPQIPLLPPSLCQS